MLYHLRHEELIHIQCLFNHPDTTERIIVEFSVLFFLFSTCLQPKLIALSDTMAKELGFTADELSSSSYLCYEMMF